MRKLVCLMIVFALAIAATAALAETATYTDRSNDFTFTYDDEHFEITFEDYQADDDDDLMLVLGGKDEAWGNVFIQMSRVDIDFDDAEEFAAYKEAEEQLISGAGATKGEWNGFQDVLMYEFDDEECLEQSFTIPCDDETLSILVHSDKIGDEEAAMARDDQISAVLDSLKFIDD